MAAEDVLSSSSMRSSRSVDSSGNSSGLCIRYSC